MNLIHILINSLGLDLNFYKYVLMINFKPRRFTLSFSGRFDPFLVSNLRSW